MAAAPTSARIRYSAMIDEDVIEQLRDIAWWERTTLTALVREGLAMVTERYCGQQVELLDPISGKIITKEAGQPYPPRLAELKIGRPIE